MSTPLPVPPALPESIVIPPRGPAPGLAIGSVLLGICGLILALLPVLTYIGVALGAAGVLIGVLGVLRARGSRRRPLIGTVISAAALGVALLMTGVYGGLFSAAPVPTPGTVGTITAADPDAGTLGSDTNPAALSTPVVLTIAPGSTLQIALGIPNLDDDAAVRAASTAAARDDAANHPPVDPEDSEDPISAATPPEGYRWATIPVTVSYHGPLTATPAELLNLRYLAEGDGPDTEAAARAEGEVVSPAPALSDFDGLGDGQAVTGNVSFLVPLKNPERGTLLLGSADSPTGFRFKIS